MKCRVIAKASFAWVAQTPDELDINPGEMLLIIDDSDKDWWLASQKPLDTFQEVKTGLVPVNYVEEASPLKIASAMFDYTATNEEEISLQEGDYVRIYELVDGNWWWVKVDDNVGLVPASYLEVTEDNLPNLEKSTPARPESIISEVSIKTTSSGGQAAAQKRELFGVLDKFGFPDTKKSTSANALLCGPQDIEYYPVTYIDKKKKKKTIVKGSLGVDAQDHLLYFLDSDSNEVLNKTPLFEITKYKEKKTKLLVEFGKDTSFDFEGDKTHIKKLYDEIQQALNSKDKISQSSIPVLREPQQSRKNSIVKTQSPVVQKVQSKLVTSSSIVAIALYDYTPLESEELEIKEGDNLIVLDDTDSDWWLVKIVSKKGGEGLVPKTYIEVQIPKVDAESGSVTHEMANMRIQEDLQAKRHMEEEMLEQEQARKKLAEQTRLRDEETRRTEDLRVKKQLENQAEERRRLEVEQRRIEDENARRLSEARKPSIPTRPVLAVSSPPQIPKRADHNLSSTPPIPQRPTGASNIPQKPLGVSPKYAAASQGNPAIPERASKSNNTPELRNPLHSGNIPGLPPRGPPPSDRPQAPTSRTPIIQSDTKSSHSDKPDPSKIREWTDKSGSFKVEAAYLGIVDNKVQLHKTNGVKIGVPLDKLDAKAMEFLITIPGNESIFSSHASSSMPVPLPTPLRSKMPSMANMLSGNPEFICNNFDWREWFIKAGVASNDSSSYAKKFVEQKMDQTILPDLDKDTLRTMGISEGDIIRIRKAANLPSVSSAFIRKATENESKAQQMNLSFLSSKSQNNSQILNDEAYARQLQAIENAKSDRSSTAVNPAALKLAGSILAQDSSSFKSNSNSTASGLPFGFNQQTSLHNNHQNDPWATFPSNQDQEQRKANEAKKELEKAHNAIQRAQEQATQAAILDNQTKAMRAQQQQNDAVLAKAQETARNAIIIQQQAEQALVNAQKNANIAAQQSYVQQQQPVRLAAPLIPTPSIPSNQFLPTKPQQVSNANIGLYNSNSQYNSNSSMGPSGPADPYSAFSNFNPASSSVFSTKLLTPEQTGSSINPSSSASNANYNQNNQNISNLPMMKNNSYPMQSNPSNMMQPSGQASNNMSGINNMTGGMGIMHPSMTNPSPGMNNLVGGGNISRNGQGMNHLTSNIQGNSNSLHSLGANVQGMSGNMHMMNTMSGGMASGGVSGNMAPLGSQLQGSQQPGFNTTMFNNSNQMMQTHGMFGQTMQNQGIGIQNQGLQNQGMNMQGFQNLGMGMQNQSMQSQNRPNNYNVLNTQPTSMGMGMNQFGNQNIPQQPPNMMNQPQANMGMLYNPNMGPNSAQQQNTINPNVGQSNAQQQNAMNSNYQSQGFQGKPNNNNFNSGGYGNR